MPLFIDALKEYNKNEIKWTVPKKGTEDYNKVIKIMNELKAKTAKPTKKTEKPVKKTTENHSKFQQKET